MPDKNSARTKPGSINTKIVTTAAKRTLTAFKKKNDLVGSAITKSAIPQKSSYKKPVIPEYLRSVSKKKGDIIRYVLDTNIIMHQTNAIFKFDEHEVGLSGQTMQELDVEKSSMGSESGQNVRATVRYLADLVKGKTKEQLASGLILEPPPAIKNGKPHTGKIFWDYSKPDINLCEHLDVDLDLSNPDHRILLSCLKLQTEGKKVVLITNDKNFRILATHAGVASEEYFSEVAEYLPTSEEDVITGLHKMGETFWTEIGESYSSGSENGVDYYAFDHPMFKQVHTNQFIQLPDESLFRIIEKENSNSVFVESFHHHVYKKVAIPKNIGQVIALELLMDKNVPCVLLNGAAGSGKTFLALAAAIAGKEAGLYDRIIVTRSLADVDQGIGFLPGTEEEKMTPWLGAITDNLAVILGLVNNADNEIKDDRSSRKVVSLAYAMEMYNIQFKSLNYMRGRSFPKTCIIHDESQNTNLGQMKTLTTRVGEGSKIIHLGNVAQIDNDYLTAHTCGLSVFLRKSIETQTALVAGVTLEGVVRSPLAEWAEKNL